MLDKKTTLCSALLLLGLGVSLANAKVTEEESDRLGKDLTPYGGEVAGNKDGSIPKWPSAHEAVQNGKIF